MQILINKYRITSHDGGYKVAKAKGEQWSALGHYHGLDKAIIALFDHRVLTETKDFIIDFNDAMNFETQKLTFLNKVKEIKKELEEGLK
jgi:hypothetical protein